MYIPVAGGRKKSKREAARSTKCFPLLRRNLPSKISFRSAEGVGTSGWMETRRMCVRGERGEGARRNDTDERTWEEEEGEGEGWRESEQGGGDARGDPRVR